MYIPSVGGSSTPSASSASSTLKPNCSVSMANWYLRAYTCSAPVMKPCGKKKPGSQNTAGSPLVSHPRMNSILALKSLTHPARGFRLGYATFAQLSGTLLLSILSYMSSRSPLITTRPCSARRSSRRLLPTLLSRRLKRSISCPRTVPSEFTSPPAASAKVLSCASSRSSFPGRPARISCASSSTSSSPLLPSPPPPPVARGCIESTVSTTLRVSWSWKLMLALACIPNTSGASIAGRDLMYDT
mmetsp:Transcript_18357/g.62448  ORF Transcript_18357/g.62448 Transcript_18357/m.62448 type:complete len:244 (+) Transcript_18357:374-1105(+)